MYTLAVVDFSHIDHLQPTSSSNIFRQSLLLKGFHGGLDRIHLVSRPAHSRRQVADAGGTSNLIDQMLAAQTESCTAND
jgi:hypothetical protein